MSLPRVAQHGGAYPYSRRQYRSRHPVVKAEAGTMGSSIKNDSGRRSRHPFPMSAPQPRRAQRRQWPPPPTVEEEEESLSREHTPELVSDHVQVRGAVDQQPIMVEVAGARAEQPLWSPPSMDSHSSDDSSGPPTPTDAVPLSSDRRYVHIPTYQPESSNESDARGRRYRDSGGGPHEAAKDPGPVKDLRPKTSGPTQSEEDVVAATLKRPRERTPYSYRLRTDVDRKSGDYSMSPAAASPSVELPTLSRSFTPDPLSRRVDLRPSYKERSASSSAATMPRPQLPPRKSGLSRPPTPETVRPAAPHLFAPPPAPKERSRNSSPAHSVRSRRNGSNERSSGSEWSNDESRRRYRAKSPSARSSRESSSDRDTRRRRMGRSRDASPGKKSRRHRMRTTRNSSPDEASDRSSARTSRDSSPDRSSRRYNPRLDLTESTRALSQAGSRTPRPSAQQQSATYSVPLLASDTPLYRRRPSHIEIPRTTPSTRSSHTLSPLHSPDSSPLPSSRPDQPYRPPTAGTPRSERPSNTPRDYLSLTSHHRTEPEARRPKLPPRVIESVASPSHAPLQSPAAHARRPSGSSLRQNPPADCFGARPAEPRTPASVPNAQASPAPLPVIDQPTNRPSVITKPALPPRTLSMASASTPTSIYTPQFPDSPAAGRLSAPFHAPSKRPSSSGNPTRTPTGDAFDTASTVSSRARRSFELPGEAPSPAPRPALTSTTTPTPESVRARPPPQLPPCPRPDFSTNNHDWATLPSAPDFDVCPTCARGLYDAGFAGSFVPGPRRPPGHRTRCDLGNPWVRMAWLVVLQSGQPRRTELVERVLAVLAATSPCPDVEGQAASSRAWSRVYNRDSGKCVPDFDVCEACTQLTQTLFPVLQGAAFRPAAPSSTGSNSAATTIHSCRLGTSSPHFATYIDHLDEASRHAVATRRPPDLGRFVALAHRVATVLPCDRDCQVRNERWHFPPALPDFTVCQACYLEAVLPQVARGSAVARAVGAEPRTPREAGSDQLSCQLYSPRMRQIWASACAYGDLEVLKGEVLRRVRKERELQGKVEESVQLPLDRGLEQRRWLAQEWKKWE